MQCQADSDVNAKVRATACELDTWYHIDLRIVQSGDVLTIDWRVDGVEQTQYAYTYTAGPSWSRVNFGNHIPVGTGGTVYFDNFVLSVTSADYPIGDLEVVGLRPTADGTHNAGTDVIEDQSGNDIGAVSAYPLLDADPWVNAPSEYIRQVASGNSNYAEVLFANTSETDIYGAMALLAYHCGNGGAANGGCVVIDEDSTETAIWGSQSSTQDYYAGADTYKSVILPTPAGGWDQSAVNALKSRMGYSTAIAGPPWWLTVIVEVAYLPSTGVISHSPFPSFKYS